MRRKIVSLLLALALLVSLLPTGVISAQAAADEGDWDYSIDRGKVTITGYNGTETDLVIPRVIRGFLVTAIGSSAFRDCDSLTSVTIPDSVTTIGERAFYCCDSLTSITIPDSVTTIGEYAFSNCFSLASVILGNGVTTIGDDAFFHCDSLTSITIPDTVTDIGEYAFSDCVRLTSITIPDSVTTIGVGAFKGCYNLTSAIIGNGVTSIGEYAFYDCGNLTSVTIGNGVISIGSLAFQWCTNLTSITIPDSVTTIGPSAFGVCPVLTTVYYGGTEAQRDAIKIESDNVWLLRAIWRYKEVVDEAGWAFTINGDGFTVTGYHGTETDLVIPSTLDGLPVTKIGNHAFFFCNSLTSVTVPDCVTTIGDDAFFRCDRLTSVTMGSSVTTIGSGAFCGCDSLTKVYYGGTEDQRDAIAMEASNEDLLAAVWNYKETDWYYTTNDDEVTITSYLGTATNIAIPSTIQDLPVTAIAYEAFYGTNLTSITIPDSVTTIGSSAFRDCDSLTSVTIPDSVTSIGSSAFRDCDSLTSVIIGSGVNRFGSNVFYNCDSLTSVTIPDTVTDIGEYAFYDCDNLASITIPDSVTTIGVGAFFHCDNLASVTIGNGITVICEGTFYSCVNLTNLILGDGVIRIGNEAFWNCDSLTSVTIPDSVTSIGGHAFARCDSLTSITIPDSITHISDYAFDGCTNLNYTVYDGAKYLGNESNPYVALMDTATNAITQCQIYSGTKLIADFAFFDCYLLATIVIPDSVCSIGEYAFKECNKLTSVKLGNGVTSMGDGAFFSCSSLTSIEIPDSVTSIGEGVFQYCSSLTSITIPDSVKTIGDCAFYWCVSLTTVSYGGTEAQRDEIEIGMDNEDLLSATWQYKEAVDEWADWDYIINGDEVTINGYLGTETDLVIPSTIQGLPVTSIGNSAFFDCDSLTGITIPDSVTTIGDRAFYDCESLASITIPESVTSIGYEAFRTCASLTSITIPESVTSIGYGAFENCISLTSIIIPGSVTSIGDSAFRSCYSLTSITIPDSVTGISDWAFAYCESLTSITIPESVTSIGGHAFRYCNSLTSITIPGSVTSVGEFAFYTCTNLTTVSYGGTEAQQEKIAIASGNEDLLSATWQYKEVAPTVIAQPESYVGAIGDTPSFTFTVTGSGLTYQWYYRFNGGDWLKSGQEGCTTATLKTKLLAYRDGYEFKCVVTDANGNVVESDTASMTVKKATLSVVQQPQDYVGVIGDTPSFTFEVTGNGLTYQWYYRFGGGNWLKSSGEGYNTATLKTKLLAYRDGYEYKCVVTDASGSTVESTPASMTIKKAAVTINRQPQNVLNGVLNQTYTFQVEAEGENLTYQWEYSADGGATWTKSGQTGSTTNKLEVKLLAYRDGQMYRCVITSGQSKVTSAAAKLKLLNLKIQSQPESYKGALNDNVTFTVAAVGDGLTYQWYYRFDGGAWLKSSGEGYNTATLKTKLLAYRDGYEYKCVITDEDGNVVESDPASMTVKKATITVVQQPRDYVGAIGDAPSFTFAVTGNGLTYQWYYRFNGSAWMKSSNEGYNTATLKTKLLAYRDGYEYKCVVTDADGNVVESDPASMTVEKAAITIVNQPQSVTNGVLNTTYTFHVEADGENLTYQWEYSRDGGVTWEKSWATGYSTNALQIPMKPYRDGQMFRCRITSGTAVVTTDVATLRLA